MRVRSLLLGACMVVVPMLAMFSHHLPPGLATTAQHALWEPLVRWSVGRPLEDPPAADAGPPPSPIEPGPAAAPAPAANPAANPAVASPRPAAVPKGSPSPLFAGPAVPARREALETRLRELGASAIRCQPLQDGSGLLLASCRVAVDPAGQLQRVFQVAGGDPTQALERLVVEVSAWKQRTAAAPGAGPGS